MFTKKKSDYRLDLSEEEFSGIIATFGLAACDPELKDSSLDGLMGLFLTLMERADIEPSWAREQEGGVGKTAVEAWKTMGKKKLASMSDDMQELIFGKRDK